MRRLYFSFKKNFNFKALLIGMYSNRSPSTRTARITVSNSLKLKLFLKPKVLLQNFMIALGSLALSSCSSDVTQHSGQIIISGKNKWQQSTVAGNLMATAIRDQNDLDFVFYPTAFIDESKIAVIKPYMNNDEINSVTSIYPDNIHDQFLIGSLSGRTIKHFLFLQAESSYRTELEVAGLKYDFKFVGGENTIASVTKRNGNTLDDTKNYRVAISNTFFFSGQTAPGYLFGFGFNFNFRRYQEQFISAKTSLKNYLQNLSDIPHIEYSRASVSRFNYGDKGHKATYQIQGQKHLSPLRGYQVTTKGVITAIGFSDRYPGGYDIYIQDQNGDSNSITSDALFVYLKNSALNLAVGDLIEVSGVVYEQRFNSGRHIPSGLTRTSIREVSDLKILSINNLTPEPTVLGQLGRSIPHQRISTYNANLNQKPSLNMNDGIDFWESLESMFITINNPKVVGFSGGEDKFQDKGPKSYLNLYLKPDGDTPDPSDTPAGGAIIDEETHDYNPNLVSAWTHHLSYDGLNRKSVFNVGDLIHGKVTGLLTYEKSFFNDGHYALLLTEKQESFKKFKEKQNKKIRALKKSDDSAPIKPEDYIVALKDRPKTTILPSADQVTVATYNVENLSLSDTSRLKKIAQSISVNLKCPDILTLVEIQDFNGVSTKGGSDATKTLEALIKKIPCSDEVSYELININPNPNSEGGQPGGNIRVSMIYNSKRVGFNSIPNEDPLAETFINAKTGALSHNPGRVFPNDSAFKRTRKSIIAEFSFKGERLLVIGNHFNSKLGDASLWGAIQPPVLKSIKRRTNMADKINDFVELLVKADPQVNIIVAGDFNAHLTERAMKSLEGDDLTNLILYKNLVKKNDRYTTNHNGNSQALDYILANKRLLTKYPKVEILHINSDFMHKHSDHDPLVSGFTFK